MSMYPVGIYSFRIFIICSSGGSFDFQAMVGGFRNGISGPTPWPLYKSADAAAAGFAQYVSKNLDARNFEYSSVIYQIVKDKISYFSFTRPVRFDKDSKARDNSPGPMNDTYYQK